MAIALHTQPLRPWTLHRIGIVLIEKAKRGLEEGAEHQPSGGSKAEYLLLQGFYEDYNKRALSLKAIAVPLLGAGLALGLEEASSVILIATIAVAAALWLLEGVWKSSQYRHALRIQAIETCYRSGSFEEAGPPFQISFSWFHAGDRYRLNPLAWMRILARPFVMFPYALALVAGLLAIASLPPGQEAPPAGTKTGGELVASSSDGDLAAGRNDSLATSSPGTGGFGNTASIMLPPPPPVDGEPDSGRTALFGGLIVVAALLGIGLALAMWKRRRISRSSPTDGATAEAGLSPSITSVGALAALMAFLTALAALSKLGQSWWLASPILVAPILTFFVARSPRYGSYRWLALSVSFLVLVGLVSAFLIPSTVRGQPGLWPGELGRNFSAAAAEMKFADFSAMVVALFTYLIALVGGASAPSQRPAARPPDR